MFKRLRKLSRRPLLLTVVLVLLLALIGFGLARDNKNDQSANSSDGNLNSPTSEEKQAADNRKDEIVEEQKQQNSSQSSEIKNVTVVITSATSTDVRGYTSGVFEDGGTCSATATKGSQTFSQTSSGFANVSYTQCTPINWSSPLSKGSWLVNLSYRSTTAQGSTSQTIEVK